MRTKAISQDVLNALASIEWDGPNATLTCGQLDRKTYVATNEVLETLGGKWNKKAKAHVFESNEADALEATIESGQFSSAADAKQTYGFFETPDWLAAELIEHANITNEHTVLEPSAGSGQLVRQVRRIAEEAHVEAVEIQEQFKAKLMESTVFTEIADFMQWEATLFYDRVVMNPPFAKQADVDHVTKAFGHLAEGGRLAAIMSSGWTFRTNKKSLEFCELVRKHGRFFHNDPGSFKESGTMVNTVIVVLDKQ